MKDAILLVLKINMSLGETVGVMPPLNVHFKNHRPCMHVGYRHKL